MGEPKNVCRVLVGKPERKRPLRRTRHRRDDIKIDLKVVVWNNVNRINLAPARDQKQLCEHANKISVPNNEWNLTNRAANTFLTRALLHDVKIHLSRQ